jgi:hypothetical protein
VVDLKLGRQLPQGGSQNQNSWLSLGQVTQVGSWLAGADPLATVSLSGEVAARAAYKGSGWIKELW